MIVPSIARTGQAVTDPLTLQAPVERTTEKYVRFDVFTHPVFLPAISTVVCSDMYVALGLSVRTIQPEHFRCNGS